MTIQMKAIEQHSTFMPYCLLYFIMWPQQYARSDWLPSGHYFLVMAGQHENFSQLDGSFEL